MLCFQVVPPSVCLIFFVLKTRAQSFHVTSKKRGFGQLHTISDPSAIFIDLSVFFLDMKNNNQVKSTLSVASSSPCLLISLGSVNFTYVFLHTHLSAS